jgi:hypothetical protein
MLQHQLLANRIGVLPLRILDIVGNLPNWLIRLRGRQNGISI